MQAEDTSGLVQGQTIKPGHHIRHDLRVAYELLLDAKRHKLRIADMVQAQQDHSRTPPANGSSPIRISLGNSTPPSGSKVDMTRGSGLGGTMGGAGMHPQHLSGGIGGTQPPTRRRRWYLGIQSKKDPSHVMTEVYKAMFALDCLWHQMTNYRVLCLWKRGAMAGAIGGPDGQMQPHDDAVMGELVRFILLLLPSPALKPLYWQQTMLEQGDLMDTTLGGKDGDNANASDGNVKIALSLYKVQQNIFLLDFQRIEVRWSSF